MPSSGVELVLLLGAASCRERGVAKSVVKCGVLFLTTFSALLVDSLVVVVLD